MIRFIAERRGVEQLRSPAPGNGHPDRPRLQDISRKLVIFVSGLFAFACSQPTASSGPPSRVIVRPSADTLELGQTIQFVDTVEDANGHVLSGQTVVWGSDNTAIATISVTGLATAISPGTTTIQAASGGVSGSATVTVVASNTPTSELFVFDKDTLVPFGMPYDISQHVRWVLKNAAGDSVGASALTGVSAVSYYPVLGNGTPGNCTVSAAPFIASCPDGGWPTTGASAYQYNGYWSVTVHAKSVNGVPDQHNTIWWYVSSSLPGSQPLHFFAPPQPPVVNALADQSVSLAQATTFSVQTAAGQTVATVPIAAIVSAVFDTGSYPNPVTEPGDPVGCTITGLVINCPEDGNQYLELVNYAALVIVTPSSFNGIANPAFVAGVELDITEPPPPTVSIIPALDTLIVGDSVQLVVDTLATGGNELPVAASTVQWLDGNTSVDTVSQSGMVYALSPGTGQIEAGVTPESGSDNENFGTATIVVLPAVSGAQTRTQMIRLQRSAPLTPAQRRQVLSEAARLKGQQYPVAVDSLRAVRSRSTTRLRG